MTNTNTICKGVDFVVLVQIRPVKRRRDWKRNRELPERREPRMMRSGLQGRKHAHTHAY